MKAISDKQFRVRLKQHLAKPVSPDYNFNNEMAKEIRYFTEGKIILKQQEDIPQNEGTIYLVIIKDPTFYINDNQLCQIFDEGNHCLSEGSTFITGDVNLLVCTWSNIGHI